MTDSTDATDRIDLQLDQLLELEHAGWRSLCAATGGAHYGPLMTDDAVMVLVNGMVLDREQVIASLDQSPPWDDYEIAEPRRIALGDDSAALVYRATAHRGTDTFTALMTSTYRIIDDAPRLAVYQQTTITH